jgi:hypothetical protein
MLNEPDAVPTEIQGISRVNGTLAPTVIPHAAVATVNEDAATLSP